MQETASGSRTRLIAQICLNVFFLLVSAYAYHDHLNDPPAYIHAWAQADRFSMALKYNEHGLDLFDPRTHNLMTPEGRTPAELPVHSYVPALLMRALGAESPAIMRGYTLAMSLLGLNFLFLLAWRFRPDPVVALFPPLFLFLAPVYFYYQANMLPGLPAFAMVLAAGWLVLRNRDSGKPLYWFAATALFALAALSRIPMLMYFLAVAIWRLWFFWRDRKMLFTTLGAVVVVCGLVLAQYLLNSAKAEALGGSMFLGRIWAFESLSEARNMFLTVAGHWSLDYFSLLQWLTLLIFLLFGFAEWRRADPEGRPWNRQMLFLWTVTTGGVLAYAWLMGKGYKDHDYYALGTIYPGTMVLLLALAPWVPLPRSKAVRIAGLGALAVLWLGLALVNYNYRTTSHDWDKGEQMRLAFAGGEQLLDQLNVPTNARVLVLDAWSPNQMLLLLERDGYTVYETAPHDFEKGLNDYDYDFIVEPAGTREAYDLDAQFGFDKRFRKIGSNGKLNVYAPVEKP